VACRHVYCGTVVTTGIWCTDTKLWNGGHRSPGRISGSSSAQTLLGVPQCASEIRPASRCRRLARRGSPRHRPFRTRVNMCWGPGTTPIDTCGRRSMRAGRQSAMVQATRERMQHHDGDRRGTKTAGHVAWLPYRDGNRSQRHAVFKAGRHHRLRRGPRPLTRTFAASWHARIASAVLQRARLRPAAASQHRDVGALVEGRRRRRVVRGVDCLRRSRKRHA
jgi:hypothetical protein